MKTAIGCFVGLLLAMPQAQAAAGKLKIQQYRSKGINWHVEHPRVVFAFGYMQEGLVQSYSKLAQTRYEPMLKEIHPDLKLDILARATGQDVVKALMDPSTVGLIFIAHSFRTQKTGSTILLGADGHFLPSNLLSAATAALRFVSLLGCHGSTLETHYEVQYQLHRPKGRTLFYESEDEYLATSWTLIDSVKKVLDQEIQDLQRRWSPLDVVKGVIQQDPGGVLEIEVKDVFPRVEPRYVRVNDQIVGVLGADVATSNEDKGYRKITYPVPEAAFWDDVPSDFSTPWTSVEPECHDIRIQAAELSPGAIVDHYLIQSIRLTSSTRETRKMTFSPAWRLGEDQMPPQESQRPSIPHLSGSRAHRRQQLQEYTLNLIQFESWIDRSIATWQGASYQGRYFQFCL